MTEIYHQVRGKVSRDVSRIVLGIANIGEPKVEKLHEGMYVSDVIEDEIWLKAQEHIAVPIKNRLMKNLRLRPL